MGRNHGWCNRCQRCRWKRMTSDRIMLVSFRSIFNQNESTMSTFSSISSSSLFSVPSLPWTSSLVSWSTISINRNGKWVFVFLFRSIRIGAWSLFVLLVGRRWFDWNVYDRWSEEILQCDEENGHEKTDESSSKTSRERIKSFPTKKGLILLPFSLLLLDSFSIWRQIKNLISL